MYVCDAVYVEDKKRKKKSKVTCRREGRTKKKRGSIEQRSVAGERGQMVRKEREEWD